MVGSPSPLFALLGGLLCLVAACGESEPSRASSSASASASLKPPDQERYCSSVCERATRCGIEQLEKSLKANAVEVGVLNRVRGQAEQDRRECEASCSGEQAKPEQMEQLRTAQSCLAQETCDTFALCLGALAPSQ